MAVIQTIPIVTQISALEPLAGAGLAINLAYLALDRFRYRSEIEPLAEAKCQAHDDDEKSLDDFHELDVVKELRWLARRQSSRTYLPRGRGAIVYRYAFRKHQDVFFAATASIICAFTMATGVALSVGRWKWALALGTPPIPGLLLYLCLASMLIPAALVVLGRKCVVWGKNRIDHCTSQVAITLAALVKNSRAPETITDGFSMAARQRLALEIERSRREADRKP